MRTFLGQAGVFGQLYVDRVLVGRYGNLLRLRIQVGLRDFKVTNFLEIK